jgi:hypothetical protein
MPVINCTSCQSALNVPDDFLGMKAMCPSCGTMFIAGAADPVVVATPVEPNPFDFPGPSSDYVPLGRDLERSPNEAFGIDNRLDDSELRQRARRHSRPAADMMRRAATTMVVWCLIWSLGQGLLGGILVLIISAFLALLFGTPIIGLIYNGAARLQNYGSYGVAMTGTVLCFLVGSLAALASLGWSVYAVFVFMNPMPHFLDVIIIGLLPNILLAAAVAVLSFLAGIKAVGAFNNPDVAELFRKGFE